MRKNTRLIAVLLAVCMLCGCSAAVYIRGSEEPQLQFYYCASGSGVTDCRVRHPDGLRA